MVTDLNDELAVLREKTESLEEKNKSLERMISEMKSPFSVEVLGKLVDAEIDESYSLIKSSLVKYLANELKCVNYATERAQLLKNLDSYGLVIVHDMVPVNVQFNNFRNDILYNSIKIDFENPRDVEKDRNSQYCSVTFNTINDSPVISSVIVSYWSNPGPFANKLIGDSVDFVKSALWGKTVSLIDDEKFDIASNLILNNGLVDLATRYISNNKDNKKLLTNMYKVVKANKDINNDIEN